MAQLRHSNQESDGSFKSLAGKNPLIDINFDELNKKVKAAPVSAAFLFPDNLTLGDVVKDVDFSALSDSEKHRLVKASKSPTDPETVMNAAFSKQKYFIDQTRLMSNHAHMLETGETVAPNISGIEYPNQITPLNSTGCRAVFEFREWCDEWRVRSEVDGQNLNPPEQAGERISEMLSSRGATKIAESCAYMAECRGGFKTFVTGTFSTEARERVANGETTIQKEVSRTMDAMGKMYRRGWTRSDGARVDGIDNTLSYSWVVEVPKNEEGEDNPHVHMLLGWRVAYSDFEDWSKRIEGLWGNGYFHLEKIKDSTCAGAYMAKAAGYLSKAAGDDTQGVVTGNRYGISACARAPGWETYAIQQLHCMSQLIVDVYDHLSVKYGEKYRKRKKLNSALSAIPKEKKALRQRVGKKLAEVRQELNKLPVRCNKYQVLLRGKGAFYRFMNWAINDTDNGDDWLPAKGSELSYKPGASPEAKDSLYHTKLRDSIKGRKFWRRIASPPKWLNWCDSQWGQIKKEYESMSNRVVEENPIAMWVNMNLSF